MTAGNRPEVRPLAVDNEWQERPKGQTSDYALGVAWLAFSLLTLALLVPGRSGGLQVVSLIGGVLALALAVQSLKRAWQKRE